MDFLSILNYQGSKRNLIEFIHKHTEPLLLPGKTILDIFAGTCSVGYSFKRTNRVYANDCEKYAAVISEALLSNYNHLGYTCHNIADKIKLDFDQNMSQLHSYCFYRNLLLQETLLLDQAVADDVIQFYDSVPTIWNGQAVGDTPHSLYCLFLQYYSNTYFGVKQAAEIDSLRFAIEASKGTDVFPLMMASLYYAMKEAVFAKDGHMAQPLNLKKNFNKLIKQRNKSIYSLFISKFSEFFSDDFIVSNFNNQVFNMDFEDLLNLPEIQKDVDLIYADPPYTDMQYSRYYHLLNFVTRYQPLPPTLLGGSYTKGLYTEGRFQSQLSAKSKSLGAFTHLIDFAYDFKKNLVISFAYPVDTLKQKTDRYVMSIDSLQRLCISRFGEKNVLVESCDYTHSNNRNSENKAVREYLLICRT